MADRAFDVEWWIAGPPAYVARVRRARIEGADAEALAVRLDALGFFDLPGDLDQGRVLPDATGFGVTVSNGTRSHKVEFSGLSGGSGLTDLIRWLDARPDTALKR